MSIRINDLTVRFKNGVVAVNKASLEIPKGIYGLLGENGAGKTTLMRVLTTVLKQTEGVVSIDGILYNEGNYEKGKFFIFWKREWVAGKCKGLCLELYGTKCRRSPFVRSQLFYII